MLTARCLRQEGMQVALLERGEPGREASWAGGGILSPLYPWRYPEPVTRLASLGQRSYPQFSEGLYEETGVDPEWTPSGLLILDIQEAEAAQCWGDHFGVPAIALGPSGVRGCEPVVADRFGAGIWLPTIAQMRNPRLMKALRRALERARIDVRPQTPVTEVRIDGGRVRGVHTPQGEWFADRVVLASGAWTSGLMPPRGPAVQIEPVKGQMVLFKGSPGVLRRMVLYRDRYLIPRRDGRIVVGSTLEYTGFDKTTTDEARTELIEAAITLVPALAGLDIEYQWAGLRPGSNSSIPYVGEHPEIEGLFVNAGHFRNGVVLGLGSVQLLVDLILGRAPPVPPTPYGLLPRTDHRVPQIPQRN